MTNQMNSLKLFAYFLIINLSNNYVLNYLGHSQIPSAFTLMLRGVGCYVCVLFVAIKLKQGLIPQKLKPQILRFFLSGLGLFLLVESYHYAKPSEIAFVSKLDVPIIMIFGSFVSLKVLWRQKVVAFITVVSILGSIWIFSDEITGPVGLGFAALGTLCLSMSYLLLSYTARNENATVVSSTPALSCVFFGGVVYFCSFQNVVQSTTSIVLALFSGGLMYLSYQVSRALYRKYDFFNVQMLAVSIPLCSILLDLVIYKSFRLAEYLTFFCISIGIVTSCLLGKNQLLKKQGDNYDCKESAA